MSSSSESDSDGEEDLAEVRSDLDVSQADRVAWLNDSLGRVSMDLYPAK